MPDEDIAGILLAAGAGSRFGTDKLAAMLDGESLLQRSAAAMFDAGLAPVLAVVQPGSVRPIPDRVIPVVNDRWRAGIATSIQTGLADLSSHPRVGAVVISPADQPRCGAEVYRRLVATFRLTGSGVIVAAFDGAMRNPVLLARRQWPLAGQITGDAGLGAVVRPLGPTTVECADIGSVDDVDTPADLDRMRRVRNLPTSARRPPAE